MGYTFKINPFLTLNHDLEIFLHVVVKMSFFKKIFCFCDAFGVHWHQILL
eukprot:11026.XXX_493441_493590_1 [CDS] Oithona nana genome sequencing.